jgi:hypothetical protein
MIDSRVGVGSHFVIDGTVVAWDPVTRVFELHSRRLVLAPTVGPPLPEPGARVTASGYEDAEGQWVVTTLSLQR